MFDCYHFWAGLSKFEDLDLIRDAEIHHVHFQDVPGIPRELLDNGTREIPGDGVSPLVGILRKLAEKNYRGPLSVELFYPICRRAIRSKLRRASGVKPSPFSRRRASCEPQRPAAVFRAENVTRVFRSGESDLVVLDHVNSTLPPASGLHWSVNRARANPRCCICSAVWTGQRAVRYTTKRRTYPDSAIRI